jgi:CopG family transcriptional regulator/antitoxin EndoAI
MRTTETMTVSLPPALARQIEEVQKIESRTRSELVREALRVYVETRYPAVQPTKAELLALRRGRAAFQRGDAVPFIAMQSDPFQGDLRRLKGKDTAWRRRVGNYRIIYDLYFDEHLIVIQGILRRTSTTYE